MINWILAVLFVLVPGVPLEEQLPEPQVTTRVLRAELILQDPVEHVTEVVAETEGKDSETLPPPEGLKNASAPEPQSARNVWDRLAECESGNWINGGASFEEGSARWWWGEPGRALPPWGTHIHHGGLQFHPDTWNWLKPDGYPQYAYQATREQQIVVAERVLEAQGWRAWPVCSKKLSLR